MKAKEYYVKYGDALKDPNHAGNAVIDARHIKTQSGVDALERELNEKGNVPARMFDPPVLRTDWWKVTVENYIKKRKIFDDYCDR